MRSLWKVEALKREELSGREERFPAGEEGQEGGCWSFPELPPLPCPRSPSAVGRRTGGSEKVPYGRPHLSFDTLESPVMVDAEKPGEGFPGALVPATT